MAPLRNRTSLSLVADQRQYTLPVTVQKPLETEYVDASGSHFIDSLTLDRFRIQSQIIRRATIPRNYTQLETEGVILLDPIPDTAAPSTTTGSNGGSISASATSVILTSITNFPTEGRIIIGSEVIGYNNITTATKTLTGLTRGLEGTTAATQTDGATVTLRNVMIWGQRLYQDLEMRNYYTTGTVAITNNTTALVGTNSVWTTGASAGDYFGITANVTTTMPLKWYRISSVTTNTAIVLADTFTEPTQSTGTYIISSPNPFPNYCDGILIAYAASQLLKKTGRFDLANMEYATAKSLLQTALKNQSKNDTFLHARSAREGARNGRMGLWMRNQRVG